MIYLVRDTSNTPKVWVTDGIGRRHVRDGAEAAALDALNDAFWPNVAQPKYPNYPTVDFNVLFRLPIVENVA